MKPGKRFGLSAEQKIDVWRRWKAGQTLHEIGRAFGKDHNSIRGVVARHGGIVPAVRRRALLALTGVAMSGGAEIWQKVPMNGEPGFLTAVIRDLGYSIGASYLVG